MCTLGPDDDLAHWKGTGVLARVLIDGEPLGETVEHLPAISEGTKSVARWELGSLQVYAYFFLTICATELILFQSN